MRKFIIYLLILLLYSSSVSAEESYFDIIKSGTFNKKIKSKIEIEKKEKINTNFYRPELQVHYPSPKSYFLIHYDTSGVNAVDLSDKNLNGVPDYIDSVAFWFDYVYEVEVNQMGFLSPIPDSNAGGSDAYDIYVLETGIGVLHETFYGLTINDLNLYPKTAFDRFTSFTVIDNNYSSSDSTIIDSVRKIKTFYENDILALKITAAHEFHHAIQFRYGLPDPDMIFIFEMTSIAMENILFPESNDYLQYVNDFIRNYYLYDFSNPSPEVGYRYGIFAIYLYKKYGIEYLKRIWEYIYEGQLPYEALINSMKDHNTDFDDEFCNFIYDFFNAAKTKQSKSFDKAYMFVDPLFEFIKETKNNSYLESDIYPYGIKGIRFLFKKNEIQTDTLDFFLSYKSKSSLVNFDINYLKFRLIAQNFSESDFVQIQNSNYFYQLSNPDFYCVHIFLNLEIIPEIIEYSFPSPYRKRSSNKELSFPVHEKYGYNEIVKVNIYGTDMSYLFSKIEPVRIVNEKKVITIDNLPDDFTNGVYIFTTGESEFRVFGKLIVLE